MPHPDPKDYAPGQRSDQVYEKVRALIVHGALAPGSRIVESELAARLGVSRTPVRSALHRLMQEGIVAGPPGGKQTRLVVAPLTRRDGLELYDIIGALDGLAAWKAAELPADVRQAIGREMRDLNAQLLAAGRGDALQTARLMELHARLHDAYRSAVDAPRLHAMFSSIRPQADRYRRIYSTHRLAGRIEQSAAEHERILRAIEAGDPVEAQCGARENWMRSAEHLGRVIDVIGEHGHW